MNNGAMLAALMVIAANKNGSAGDIDTGVDPWASRPLIAYKPPPSRPCVSARGLVAVALFGGVAFVTWAFGSL